MTAPTASLADCCSLVTDGTHYTPPPVDVGVPFLTVKDMSDAGLDFTGCSRIAPEELARARAANSAPQPGDVLFSKDGTVGKVAVVPAAVPDFAVLSSIAIIRPRAEMLDPNYLGFMLRSPSVSSQALSKKTGSALRRIVLGDLRTVRVPLPPLGRQHRIVDLLARAEGIVRLRREAQQKAAELIPAIFIDMFGDPATNPRGWPVRQFADVGSLDRGKSRHRPRDAAVLYGGPYPFIQTGDVANSGGRIRSYSSTYSEAGLAQSKLWSAGTLCITIAANIAKTGVLEVDACFPDSVVGFVPGDLVRVGFVQAWLGFLQPTLEANAPQAAQKNINLEILRTLPIPVPPLQLQDAFVDRLERVVSITRQQLEAEAQAAQAFNALLDRAFRAA